MTMNLKFILGILQINIYHTGKEHDTFKKYVECCFFFLFFFFLEHSRILLLLK